VREKNKLTSVVVSVLGRDTIIFAVEMGILIVTRSGHPSAGGQGVSRGLNEKIAWKTLAVARDRAFFATQNILQYTAKADEAGRSAVWWKSGMKGETRQNERQSLQVSPARPSDGSNIKLKTIVILSNGRRIMIYWVII